jgi:VWFA-related protein
LIPRLTAFTLPAVFGLTAHLAGQQTASPPPVADPVIRVSVNLVQVDTVVTDSRGHSVNDLRADDFEIFEDGKPQTITNFSWNHVAPADKPVAPGPHSALNLTQGNVHRAISLMVDDSGAWAEHDVLPVMTALRTFVADEVGANDLVSVTASRGGMGIYQEFTNDKRQLNAAIDHIRSSLTISASSMPRSIRFRHGRDSGGGQSPRRR